MPAALVLDTDIGSDVDDALALALRHPDLELRAVTTVSCDTVLRARIARRLVELSGNPPVPIAAGVGGGEDRNWGGHEGEGIDLDTEPVRTDAVDVLLARLDGSTALATIGMQSNLAAALERDPTLARRVPLLVVMGGVFAPLRVKGRTLPLTADHNLVTDGLAALAALNAGLPTLYVPCDVTFRTALTRAQLERLRQGDELCAALARLVDRWIPVMRRASGRDHPPERVALMHDPLAVASLVDRSFVRVERLPVTVARHRDAIRTFVDPLEGVEADVVRDVDAAAFSEWWLEVVLAR